MPSVANKVLRPLGPRTLRSAQYVPGIRLFTDAGRIDRRDNSVGNQYDVASPNPLGVQLPTYLVFRDLPGVTRDQFVAAQRAVTDEADSARAAGRAVRYLTGFFVPANAAGLCLFEGADAEEVAAVNQQAGVPFTSVVEAVEWQPPASIGAVGPKRTGHR